MLVDGIRTQTSLSVEFGQRAPAVSHTAVQQRGLYSDQTNGKRKTLCGIGDEASTVYQFHLQIKV